MKFPLDYIEIAMNAAEKETLMQEEGLSEEQTEERAREKISYVAATFTEFLDKLHD